MARKFEYKEPSDYFPESVRKKLKLGEYAEEANETNKDDAGKETNRAIRKFVNGEK